MGKGGVPVATGPLNNWETRRQREQSVCRAGGDGNFPFPHQFSGLQEDTKAPGGFRNNLSIRPSLSHEASLGNVGGMQTELGGGGIWDSRFKPPA